MAIFRVLCRKRISDSDRFEPRQSRHFSLHDVYLLVRLIFIWLFVVALPPAFGANTNYFDLNPRSFQTIAAQELRTDSINHDLLAAAILRETNARRAQRRLPALKHSPKATGAARIQSDIMRDRGSISHENPENPKYRTLQQRIKAFGIDYRLIAENVATAFALQYQSGKPFYIERKSGRPTGFVHKPGGAPIQPHTYATFAKALVDAWMNSKGHRENILLKDAQYHGAFCSFARNKKTEMPIFYCTQVFFAEAEKSAR
jgi:uncharacterized protein YkwD